MACKRRNGFFFFFLVCTQAYVHCTSLNFVYIVKTVVTCILASYRFLVISDTGDKRKTMSTSRPLGGDLGSIPSSGVFFRGFRRYVAVV